MPKEETHQFAILYEKTEHTIDFIIVLNSAYAFTHSIFYCQNRSSKVSVPIFLRSTQKKTNFSSFCHVASRQHEIEQSVVDSVSNFQTNSFLHTHCNVKCYHIFQTHAFLYTCVSLFEHVPDRAYSIHVSMKRVNQKCIACLDITANRPNQIENVKIIERIGMKIDGVLSPFFARSDLLWVREYVEAHILLFFCSNVS